MLYLAILIFSFRLGEGHPVVNGTDGREGEFPYTVSLRDEDNEHFCGGGIISEYYILSAYHCVKGAHMKNMKIVAGTSSQTKADPRYTFGVERIYRFNNKKWLRAKCQAHDDRHDVMIMKLNRKIPVSDKVKIAKLPDQPLQPGTTIIFGGWGKTMRGKDVPDPDVIQKISTVVQTLKTCRDFANEIGFFPPYETCILSGIGRGLCEGDSGTPLIKDGVIVGVALYVLDECAEGKPDYIANVYYYKDFIVNHLTNIENIYKKNRTSPKYVEIDNLFQ